MTANPGEQPSGQSQPEVGHLGPAVRKEPLNGSQLVGGDDEVAGPTVNDAAGAVEGGQQMPRKRTELSVSRSAALRSWLSGPIGAARWLVRAEARRSGRSASGVIRRECRGVLLTSSRSAPQLTASAKDRPSGKEARTSGSSAVRERLLHQLVGQRVPGPAVHAEREVGAHPAECASPRAGSRAGR